MAVQRHGSYLYDPSFPLAMVATILFCVTAAMTLFQYFRYRSWFFYCMQIGVISKKPLLKIIGSKLTRTVETVAVAARAYSIQHLNDKTSYLIGYIGVM
jgi:hypothetical protein